MPRRLSGARVGGGGGGGGRDYGATVNSLESGGGSSLSTMARVIFFGAAAATATAAGVLAYRAHKRGTTFMDEFDVAFHEIFPSPVDFGPPQPQEQVSMAVSVADLEGLTPDIAHPGTSPGTPSSSLFLRRQASKAGMVLSDDVSIPGSLAVSSALVDGGSPSLKLPSDQEGTLIGRRSASRGSTPTASAGKNKSLAVSVDAAEGKETIIAMDPKANLLQRRSSMKVGTPVKDEAKACLEDEGVEGVHGGTIMTATVSDMEGEVSSPSLALGADSDMKASIFNRRKAQTSECTLANTTTLSAIEGAPAQVSQVDKSALLQRRQSQRSATADASSAPTTNNPAAPSDVALAAPAQAPAAPAPAAASAPAAAAPAAGDDSAIDPGDDSTPGQVPVDQARGSKGGGGKKKKKR